MALLRLRGAGDASHPVRIRFVSDACPQGTNLSAFADEDELLPSVVNTELHTVAACANAAAAQWHAIAGARHGLTGEGGAKHAEAFVRIVVELLGRL